MNQPNALVRSPQRTTRRPAGFTLTEVMIVVSIVALLAALAIPTYLDHLRKTRRADAIGRISQVQQAQERWRANNAAYGTLANVGVASTTADGYYTLSVSGTSATGYEISASATGAQSSDTSCRFLRLTMSGGNTTLASGATSSVTNSGTANTRCWNR